MEQFTTFKHITFTLGGSYFKLKLKPLLKVKGVVEPARRSVGYPNEVLLINMKFFCLNTLKTKCNSVRKRVKNALSRTLLHIVFKMIKKKNFPSIKSTQKNNLRFFTKKCTHFFKTSNFEPQGLQNAALQQRYSPC